jgi:(5-formylfuran-3-yl)methyl phosphate transaminase
VKIPERVRSIEPFLAMEVLERAQAMERDGAKVLHLELGEPDFPAPAAAVEAARKALAEGATRYTDSRGLPELRAAIAADKARRTGAAVDPEQVLVTSGTSPALLLVFSLLLEPGDEVIVPAPHYPCYPNFVRFCGGTPVPVPCDPAAGWAIDPDAVRRAVGPRTRALVIGSPANPTGAIQPRETLAALAALGVPLVSDEVYDGLVYDGAHATSALEAPGAEACFVLDGFSKRYAMTGFRLGYVIAPRAAARPLQILAQNLFISAAEFVQHAGLAALAHGAPTVEAMRGAYARRRDLLVAGLRALGFGIAAAPRGAFYVLADARRFDRDSRRLAARLLEEAHVAVTPGVDFGAAGEGFLRFCYAASEGALREALARIGRVLH